MGTENIDIGALWVSEKNGKKLTTGKLNVTKIAGEDLDMSAVSIIVFKNDYKKEGENTPDYKIYLRRPAEKKVETPPEDTTELEPF